MLTMEYIEQTHEETFKEFYYQSPDFLGTHFKVYFINAFKPESEINIHETIGIDQYFLFEFSDHSKIVETDGEDLQRMNYLIAHGKRTELYNYFTYLVSK